MLTAAQSLNESYRYPGAEHRFDRDRIASNEAAAADARQRTLTFFGKNLKE
jgi:dienelactone hydrolase